MRRGARTTPGRPRRRGFLLIEIAAAAVALAIAMATTLQVVGWAAAERRTVQRRERAVREATRALERLTARPWDALTPGSLAAEHLAPPAESALPGGRLDARVAEADAGAARRITVEVRWTGRGGMPEAPVRLTAWVYRRDGEEGPR